MFVVTPSLAAIVSHDMAYMVFLDFLIFFVCGYFQKSKVKKNPISIIQ